MSNYSKKQLAEFDKHYGKICNIKKKIDKGRYFKSNLEDITDLLVKIIDDVCEYYLKVPGDIRDNHQIDVRKVLEKLIQVKKSGELYQKVLRIKKNLKTGFYLEMPLIERGKIIIEDAKCLRKYCEEVPSDVKRDYRRKKRINVSKLINKLYEVKTK